ncbi:hypothetical protein ACFL2Q_08970 [Thermodesulfobacteriota bacterium]
MIHLKFYMVILAVLVALFVGVITDSLIRSRSASVEKRLWTISPLLPSADPGMNNSARYIRYLGLSTPASAFPDFPGQPDYLPAGMMWPPPKEFVGLTDRPPIAGAGPGPSEEARK